MAARDTRAGADATLKSEVYFLVHFTRGASLAQESTSRFKQMERLCWLCSVFDVQCEQTERAAYGNHCCRTRNCCLLFTASTSSSSSVFLSYRTTLPSRRRCGRYSPIGHSPSCRLIQNRFVNPSRVVSSGDPHDRSSFASFSLPISL